MILTSAPPRPSATIRDARLREPVSFEVGIIKSDLYSIRISGRLPMNWPGALALGLADERISIDSGYALLNEGGFWDVRLQVVTQSYTGNPERLDFAKLLAKGQRTSARKNYEIAIEEFRLEPSDKWNGSLRLELSAADQLGFLAQVCGDFAFCSLFPREMVIETIGGRISDEFYLTGFGGGPPGRWSRGALDRLLSGKLVG